MHILLWVGFLAALAAVQATDYCSSTLCSGSTHIACDNDGAWASSCPSGAYLIDMQPNIDAIVANFNDKRNEIAGGELSGFESAKRMATIQWDDELAALAALNVKQCQMQHDKCHNTNSFKMSGQDLAWMGYSGAESGTSDATIIGKLINSWWDEYKNCKMSYIDAYPNNYSGPTIGHFTVMAADHNIRLGCAASRYYSSPWNNFLFACNFATTNIIGWPIYAAGTVASGCTTGTNPQYPSLCSVNEVYV